MPIVDVRTIHFNLATLRKDEDPTVLIGMIELQAERRRSMGRITPR